ncbi:hypothetical protein BGZ60DRAFT_196354 [Tricladium varicosporioides]|nr:hypothetical protein BGZ60DRAFT_196354 [Hymenoscyphus varicosporioides]
MDDEAVTATMSWQSAIWILIPLALSAMTQPSGNFCTFPGRLQTYLRASPFVCASDTLAIILQIIKNMVNGMRLRHAIRATLIPRFVGPDEQSSTAQSLQPLEQLTFMRWILFILGTLPQAIKLCSLRGAPWTFAWGLMYLVSFLVMELLNILSRTPHDDYLAPALLGGLESSHSQCSLRFGTSRSRRLYDWALSTDGACGLIAIALQMATLFWAFHNISQPRLVNLFFWLRNVEEHTNECFLTRANDDKPCPNVASLLSMVLGMPIMLISFMLVSPIFGIVHMLGNYFFDGSKDSSCFGLLFGFISCLCLSWGAFGLAVCLSLYIMKHEYIVAFLYEIICFPLLCLSLFFVTASLTYSKTLRRNLLFIIDGSEPWAWDSDWLGVAASAFFILLLALSVLWYALGYNPMDTYKADWTNVLG